MKIQIHARDFEMNQALREHILRRCRFVLSRLRDSVRRIEIHLADENGPKGGVDKRCLVRIKSDSFSEIVIKDMESDLYVAVDRALSRAKRSLLRRMNSLRWARQSGRRHVPRHQSSRWCEE